MKPHLVVFARYPQPHRAKTRLIPALGPEGAAEVHRSMTQHTLRWARALADRGDATVEVHFEGADSAHMRDCFGNGLAYRPQASGDLGQRMAAAVAGAFREGVRRVILVGTDCPEMTADLAAEAFRCLDEHDLVVGPAADGGYYLIGFRRPLLRLFEGIEWGAPTVFTATMRRAHDRGLSVAILPTLADVDRPEDLALWRRVGDAAEEVPADASISVIIPTLNEEDALAGTLDSIEGGGLREVIVVDGGSSDRTAEIARQRGCRLLSSAAGRARQLNAGAAAAEGETLLFLHADTQLARGFDAAVRSTLGQTGTVAGAFRFRIDGPCRFRRAIETVVHFRSRYLQMPYGDQGLFLRRSVFEKVGGYPDLPIMDDFELVRRLRRVGAIRIAALPATTSGRRWRRLGPLRTTWTNQCIILGYFLGIAPERLSEWYARAGPVSR